MSEDELKEIERDFIDPYDGPNVADDFRMHAKKLIAEIRHLKFMLAEERSHART